MSTNATYTIRQDVIEREIIPRIEGAGISVDARAEFNIDQIAVEVIRSRMAHGKPIYYFNASEDQFWDSVERNDRRVI